MVAATGLAKRANLQRNPYGTVLPSFEAPMLRPRAIALFALVSTLAVAVPAQTPSPSRYAHSPDGFRLQLQDLISAYKSADEGLIHERLDTLAIPSPKDWAAAHFQSGEAPELQQRYAAQESDFVSRLRSLLAKMADSSPAETISWPMDPPSPPNRVLVEHNLPVPSQPIALDTFLYGVLQPDEKVQPTLNTSFVYLDGAFRYAGDLFPFWCTELSKGQVSPARLAKRVVPKYPKEARKQHLEGVVRLFAIIGKNGELRSVTLLAGDPLLRPAALDAVRQWRYEPTTLSGVLVEVQTVIDVRFQLKQN